jgi:creatinine amidohydrolase
MRSLLPVQASADGHREDPDMTDTVWLQDLTWEEARERIASSRGTVIVPVGSTEQHGCHLPLGTDTYVAVVLAEAGAQKAGVLAAPPLWFGWSPHHMVLPGTVTVRPEILVELAYDVIASLSRHGMENIVFVNGHRIVNVTWLQIAAERAKNALGVKVAIFDPAFMSKTLIRELAWGPVGHAEEIETSHLWHCRPDLVKMDRAKDNPHPPKPLYNVDPSFPEDTLCYVPGSVEEMAVAAEAAGGTVGRPTQASPTKGKRYHDHLVTRLAEVVRALQEK